MSLMKSRDLMLMIAALVVAGLFGGAMYVRVSGRDDRQAERAARLRDEEQIQLDALEIDYPDAGVHCYVLKSGYGDSISCVRTK